MEWVALRYGFAHGRRPVVTVQYSVINNGNNDYWNGTSFSSSSQVLDTATGTSSWTRASRLRTSPRPEGELGPTV